MPVRRYQASFLDSLKDAGFDVVGGGHNHALEWGYEACLDTVFSWDRDEGVMHT